jgi:hypothetical protein
LDGLQERAFNTAQARGLNFNRQFVFTRRRKWTLAHVGMVKADPRRYFCAKKGFSPWAAHGLEAHATLLSGVWSDVSKLPTPAPRITGEAYNDLLGHPCPGGWISGA